MLDLVTIKMILKASLGVLPSGWEKRRITNTSDILIRATTCQYSPLP